MGAFGVLKVIAEVAGEAVSVWIESLAVGLNGVRLAFALGDAVAEVAALAGVVGETEVRTEGVDDGALAVGEVVPLRAELAVVVGPDEASGSADD